MYYARSVRGEHDSYHFDNNGDGTITDIETHLMWQQETSSKLNWKDSLAYCEALSLAGYNDWHLPNKEQLYSIANYEKYAPAIDTGYFSDTVSSYYWSSSTYIKNIGNAWCVDFNYGSDYTSTKSSAYYVRCIRGGVTPQTHTLTTTATPPHFWRNIPKFQQIRI